jgi:hypothetical protein
MINKVDFFNHFTAIERYLFRFLSEIYVFSLMNNEHFLNS